MGRNFRVEKLSCLRVFWPFSDSHLQIRKSLSRMKYVLQKIRPIILQKMLILSENQQNLIRKTLNSRKFFSREKDLVGHSF